MIKGEEKEKRRTEDMRSMSSGRGNKTRTETVGLSSVIAQVKVGFQPSTVQLPAGVLVKDR